MIKNKIRNSKGISLITLTITVMVLLILTNIIIYNVADNLRIEKLKKMKNDIENLRDKISTYYAQNGAIPASIKYTNVDHIRAAGVISDAVDTGDFLVIDLSALENLTLNYGQDFESVKTLSSLSDEDAKNYTNLYIINEVSHNIFYVEGIKIDNDIYYTDYTSDEVDLKSVELKYIEGVKIPEGLAVGDTVTYEPKGETYTWEAEYCSSTKTIGTDNVDIKSGKDAEGNDQAYNIKSWKVLNINEDGSVDLIAATPTSGTVYLGESQGYNNAVYLLNAACSKLYGDSSKGITARSVNIKDIEDKMTEEALNGTNGAHKYNNGNATYNERTSSAYTSNKSYPTIYAQENLSVINGTTNNNGIGMSEQSSLIARTDNGATDGKITATTSIQPYQTYWYKDNAFMQTAFQSEGDINYYSLFMPNGSSTTYWVASRCVNAGSSLCSFYVSYVYSGGVNARRMCNSYGLTGNGSCALCPILTLSSTLLTGSHASGWTVK